MDCEIIEKDRDKPGPATVAKGILGGQHSFLKLTRVYKTHRKSFSSRYKEKEGMGWPFSQTLGHLSDFEIPSLLMFIHRRGLWSPSRPLGDGGGAAGDWYRLPEAFTGSWEEQRAGLQMQMLGLRY